METNNYHFQNAKKWQKTIYIINYQNKNFKNYLINMIKIKIIKLT